MRIQLLIVLALLIASASWAQLPDAPQPKPDPCAGTKVGAVCNGKAYYPDMLKLDEQEKTWGKAAKTPGMILGGSLLVGSTVLDIESTQACERNGTCREGNPLMGKSRAQQYAIGMSLNAVLFYLCVREKKTGHGLAPFIVLTGASAVHWMLFAHNRSLG